MDNRRCGHGPHGYYAHRATAQGVGCPLHRSLATGDGENGGTTANRRATGPASPCEPQHTRVRGSQDNGVAVAHREPHTVSESNDSDAGQRGLSARGIFWAKSSRTQQGKHCTPAA